MSLLIVYYSGLCINTVAKMEAGTLSLISACEYTFDDPKHQGLKERPTMSRPNISGKSKRGVIHTSMHFIVYVECLLTFNSVSDLRQQSFFGIHNIEDGPLVCEIGPKTFALSLIR
jgi:hypothetical protein